MRKRAYVFFSIALVLACCFFTGCASSPSDGAQQGKENAAAPPGTSYNDLRTNYSFEEVLSDVYNVPLNSEINESLSPLEIHFLSISGDDIDGVGNATSWSFVVQHENLTKFIIYDKFGESVTNWTRGYSAEEIFPDKIVPPAALVDKNRATIFRTSRSMTTESRKLELTGGNYTMVITGQNSTRILAFDATTGALISSNER